MAIIKNTTAAHELPCGRSAGRKAGVASHVLVDNCGPADGRPEGEVGEGGGGCWVERGRSGRMGR